MSAAGAAGGRSDLLPESVSPRAIAEGLFSGDREQFVRQYREALEKAKDSLDLEQVSAVLERWRGLAGLQQDPDDFASFVRTAAERLSGRPVPEDEPLDVTRARVGL